VKICCGQVGLVQTNVRSGSMQKDMALATGDIGDGSPIAVMNEN